MRGILHHTWCSCQPSPSNKYDFCRLTYDTQQILDQGQIRYLWLTLVLICHYLNLSWGPVTELCSLGIDLVARKEDKSRTLPMEAGSAAQMTLAYSPTGFPHKVFLDLLHQNHLRCWLKNQAFQDHSRSSEAGSQELEPMRSALFTFSRWFLGRSEFQHLC